MQQRPEKPNTADGDPERTLVSPRFDDEEARRAHPVVPLAAAGARGPRPGARARRRGPRRSWPTALLAVALFAVAALGGAVASMFMRRTPSTQTAAETPSAVAPEQAAEAPEQEAEAPAHLPARAEPRPAVPARPEVAEASPREVLGARSETRAPKEARARREEDAPVRARHEAAHGERESSDDEDGGRRGRREKRRGRGEYEAEKEMRKILKRAGDKAPRLVDVIVSPGN